MKTNKRIKRFWARAFTPLIPLCPSPKKEKKKKKFENFQNNPDSNREKTKHFIKFNNP